jgi:hypothetical protein
VCSLLPARAYNFTVRAFTSLAGSLSSEHGVGTTSDAGINSFTPTLFSLISHTLAANPVTSARFSAGVDHINISWTEPEPRVGAIQYYELSVVRKARQLLYYPPSEVLFLSLACVLTPKDTTVALLYNGSSTMFTHAAIEPATIYQYTIRAYTSAGAVNSTVLFSTISSSDGTIFFFFLLPIVIEDLPTSMKNEFSLLRC